MTKSDINVGSRIRAYRARRGFSLHELSEATGIAPSNLSSIELNKTSPTLKTLLKIADAFDTKVGALLDEIVYKKAIVYRKGEGDKLETDHPGHAVEILTAGVPGSTLDCRLITLEAGSPPFRPSHGLTSHFLYLIAGALRVTVDGESFHLEAGDALLVTAGAGTALETGADRGSSVLLFGGDSATPSAP